MSDIDNFTYKNKTYDQLSEEFTRRCTAAYYAFQLIPEMYARLTLVDKLKHKPAITKIREDHKDLPGFSGRNIRRYLPTDNPNVPRRIRSRRPKSSNTESYDAPGLSNTKSEDLVEVYSQHSTIEYAPDPQDYPHYGELVVKNQEFGETDNAVTTQYQIRKEKFEILTNALNKSRYVCFVLFDSNGELVKADADIDHSS
jgi:hypothetical protein